MRWFTNSPDRWRRRFALLPISIGYHSREVMWLEWYWTRKTPKYTEISFAKQKPDH